jgi:hypothetical protein
MQVKSLAALLPLLLLLLPTLHVATHLLLPDHAAQQTQWKPPVTMRTIYLQPTPQKHEVLLRAKFARGVFASL